ncbi:MAG: hypothetical protein SFX19_07435 [Alphaproteobacteria bacterium]|nr:hypothetical protein [Alphaproteobacteria bacterium]
MAVEITCKKSNKPGCIVVSLSNGGGDSQILVDAIRDASVFAQYDGSTRILNAEITVERLKGALQATGIETTPPHTELLAQASQMFSGRPL